MNFDPITSASLAVQIHLATALVALALGTVMWLRPKGTKSHKIIGKIFYVVISQGGFTATLGVPDNAFFRTII